MKNYFFIICLFISTILLSNNLKDTIKNIEISKDNNFSNLLYQEPDTRAEAIANGDVFIRGKYVQAGINSVLGTYGARNNTNRPSDFQSSRTTLFGFIVNQNKDNWQTYNGDFFTPGTPEEGFTLSIGSSNFSNNSASNLNQIIGNIVTINNNNHLYNGYNSSRVVWEGTVNNLKINIQYIATINGLFIKTITTITNIGSNTISDIYFMRNIDPDNNQTLNSSYTTTNTIDSQISSTSEFAKVTASQNDGSFFSFLSNDPRSKVSFGGFSNRNARENYLGTASFVQTVGASRTADEAISISYNIGSLAPGQSTTLDYFTTLEMEEQPYNCFLPALNGIGKSTNLGISSIIREEKNEWPKNIKGGWLVLESSNKAFIPNRIKFNAANKPVSDDNLTLVLTNPVEGMMVYDVTNDCLKVYTTKDNGNTYDWYCMNNSTCPNL